MNIIEKMQTSPNSYPEDFHLENGQYVNECPECGKAFIGHKRRYSCKVCKTNFEKQGEAHENN